SATAVYAVSRSISFDSGVALTLNSYGRSLSAHANAAVTGEHRNPAVAVCCVYWAGYVHNSLNIHRQSDAHRASVVLDVRIAYWRGPGANGTSSGRSAPRARRFGRGRGWLLRGRLAIALSRRLSVRQYSNPDDQDKGQSHSARHRVNQAK